MSDLDDPRVLFAAERTLLAWNRTAVSLVALGFVVERFGLFLHALQYAENTGQRELSFTIGLGLIVLAIVMSLLSVLQFIRVRRSLSPSEIPRGYWTWCGTLANLAVALLGALLIIYLVRGVVTT